jgi:hypothetical protein
VAPNNSSPLALLPYRFLQLATQCQELATTHPSVPQSPGLAVLLVPGDFSPLRALGGSALPTVLDSKTALGPLSKSENAKFPTRGRKAITCYSAGGTRSPVPSRYTEAHFILHLPAGESCLSHPRAGIPGPPLSGNLLLCWCLEGLPLTVHRDPTLPSETAREPLCPH